MERDSLLKEICDLAGKIKDNTSDINTLLANVTRLYETTILLKYFSNTSPSLSQQENSSSVTTKKEQQKHTESFDLFSSIEEPVKNTAVDTCGNEPLKKTTESIAKELSQRKITDIKSIIGINEKFQFINEFFEGSMHEYNTAIEQLNSFSSLSEAMNYLSHLKKMYKWSSDNAVVSAFETIVQRKFK
jgi:hypothetical protein